MIRLEKGSIFEDRFLILSLMGEGASGLVYKAEQIDLKRIVAIKLLKEDGSDGHARFLQEAKILTGLIHESIVQVLSIGIFDDQVLYMVMEFLEGETLAAHLAEGILEQKEIIRIGHQISSALSYAHKATVVHRDLKPQNIMLLANTNPVRAKILDFGLSKLGFKDNEAQHKLTQTGMLLGTVQYMSPEACMGRDVDQRSDIYSLGCILYECFAKSPPFVGDNSVGVLYQHINAAPKPFAERSISKKIDPELEAVIFKCLEKNPDDRYQSAEELQRDLRLILEERTDELNLEKSKPAKKNKNSLVVLFVLLTLLGFAVLLLKPISELVIPKSASKTEFNKSVSDASVIRKIYELSKQFELKGTQKDGDVAQLQLLQGLNEIIKNHEIKHDPVILYLVYQIQGLNTLDRKKAIENLNKALIYSRTKSGKDTLQTMYVYAGICDASFGSDDKLCESSGKKCLELAKRNNERSLPSLSIGTHFPCINPAQDGASLALTKLAKLEMKKKNWPQTEQYLRQLMQHNLGETVQFESGTLIPQGSASHIPTDLLLADCYFAQGKPALALRIAKREAEIADRRIEADDSPDAATCVYPYGAIAEWYRLHNLFKQADMYFQKCVRIAEQMHCTNYVVYFRAKTYLEERRNQSKR